MAMLGKAFATAERPVLRCNDRKISLRSACVLAASRSPLQPGRRAEGHAGLPARNTPRTPTSENALPYSTPPAPIPPSNTHHPYAIRSPSWTKEEGARRPFHPVIGTAKRNRIFEIEPPPSKPRLAADPTRLGHESNNNP